MATRIDDLLRMAMSFGASDLHLRAGSFPVIRVTGELKPLSGVTRLTQDETLEMAFSMMSNRQKQHFKEAYEVDIGYGVAGLGRHRCLLRTVWERGRWPGRCAQLLVCSTAHSCTVDILPNGRSVMR